MEHPWYGRYVRRWLLETRSVSRGLKRLFLVRLLTSLSSKLVAFGVEGQGLILIIFRRSVQWAPHPTGTKIRFSQSLNRQGYDLKNTSQSNIRPFAATLTNAVRRVSLNKLPRKTHSSVTKTSTASNNKECIVHLFVHTFLNTYQFEG